MLDWCTQKVYYIVHKFMSVTLSVITGGIYTIISESKFTQPLKNKTIDKQLNTCLNVHMRNRREKWNDPIK